MQMIIEQVSYNIKDLAPEQREGMHLEKVYMYSDDLVKRIQRVVTDHGRELGISLREPRDLQDGDILLHEAHNLVVIEVLPEDVLVISPRTLHEMGSIAHKLGNRHLPAHFEGDQMIVQYDYLVADLLVQLEIPHERENRKVTQAFRHVGHSH
jgi:urease accessory protein